MFKKLAVKFFKFELMQKKWGRKWMGGTFYYNDIQGLGIGYWADQIVDVCQSRVMATETY